MSKRCWHFVRSVGGFHNGIISDIQSVEINSRFPPPYSPFSEIKKIPSIIIAAGGDVF